MTRKDLKSLDILNGFILVRSKKGPQRKEWANLTNLKDIAVSWHPYDEIMRLGLFNGGAFTYKELDDRAISQLIVALFWCRSHKHNGRLTLKKSYSARVPKYVKRYLHQQVALRTKRIRPKGPLT